VEVELLHHDRLTYWCDIIAIPSEAVGELAEVSAMICAEAGLRQYFETVHVQTAIQGQWHREFVQ
jgi:hypothetical protein